MVKSISRNLAKKPQKYGGENSNPLLLDMYRALGMMSFKSSLKIK